MAESTDNVESRLSCDNSSCDEQDTSQTHSSQVTELINSPDTFCDKMVSFPLSTVEAPVCESIRKRM